MSSPFSIGESIRFGWEKVRTHSGIIFKVILTLFVVQIAQSVITAVPLPPLERMMALVVLGVFNIVIGTGAVVISLKLARSKPAHYADIVPPLELVVRYFFASLLAGIVIVLGLIALVIPGIYFLLRYSMVRFAIVDGKGIVESLRESGRITDGVKWKLLLFYLALIGLNLLGLLVLFVGLLVTIPVSMIAYAHVYQKLHARVERSHTK